MEPTTATVSVLKDRLDEATASLNKLIKKATRLGVQGLSYRLLGMREEKRKRQDWTGLTRTYITHWADLEVSTAPLKLGDYVFLAKLEVTPHGVLIDQIPGQSLDPKWLDWAGDCEHCRVKRARKHLFVVRNNETGQQLAVGRSCLRAFLGMDSLSHIAAYFSFWQTIEGETDEDGHWGGFRSHHYAMGVESIVAMTAVAVRLFGWCSVGQATGRDLTPTSVYVSIGVGARPQLGPRGDDWAQRLWQRLRDEYTEDDEQAAQRIIAWVRTDMPKDSPYTNNLAVLFAEDEIFDPKRLPLVVSSYSAWHRAVQAQMKKTVQTALPESDWIGEQGERLREMSVIYDGSFVVGANAYSDVVLANFHTEQGHVLKWFTSRGIGARVERGESLLLTGTVKEHTIYKGVRQTVLSRCKAQAIEQGA